VSPSRPYIIRALYDWICDNDCTPHLLVDAGVEGVDVPRQYVSEGQIVLNIAPSAVIHLEMGNEFIGFNGRFGGVPTDVWVPVQAVRGIYARENGQGMMFDDLALALEPDADESPEDDPTPPVVGGGSGRPSLRVVK
jgi:stringent starvation protein B